MQEDMEHCPFTPHISAGSTEVDRSYLGRGSHASHMQHCSATGSSSGERPRPSSCVTSERAAAFYYEQMAWHGARLDEVERRRRAQLREQSSKEAHARQRPRAASAHGGNAPANSHVHHPDVKGKNPVHLDRSAPSTVRSSKHTWPGWVGPAATCRAEANVQRLATWSQVDYEQPRGCRAQACLSVHARCSSRSRSPSVPTAAGLAGPRTRSRASSAPPTPGSCHSAPPTPRSKAHTAGAANGSPISVATDGSVAPSREDVSPDVASIALIERLRSARLQLRTCADLTLSTAQCGRSRSLPSTPRCRGMRSPRASMHADYGLATASAAPAFASGAMSSHTGRANHANSSGWAELDHTADFGWGPGQARDPSADSFVARSFDHDLDRVGSATRDARSSTRARAHGSGLEDDDVDELLHVLTGSS